MKTSLKRQQKCSKNPKINSKRKIDPFLQKARSLDRGQDLKGAYETYKSILKIDPSNVEAVSKMDEIIKRIEKQAKKIYREAIIDESLNYLHQAKEKFNEVRQITPSDSPYYRRAEIKLQNYTD